MPAATEWTLPYTVQLSGLIKKESPGLPLFQGQHRGYTLKTMLLSKNNPANTFVPTHTGNFYREISTAPPAGGAAWEATSAADLPSVWTGISTPASCRDTPLSLAAETASCLSFSN